MLHAFCVGLALLLALGLRNPCNWVPLIQLINLVRNSERAFALELKSDSASTKHYNWDEYEKIFNAMFIVKFLACAAVEVIVKYAVRTHVLWKLL